MNASSTSPGEDNSVVLRHPAGSRLDISADSHVVYVPGSAGVALDEAMAHLWQAADGHTGLELKPLLGFEHPQLAMELVALRRAGLLLPPWTAETQYPKRHLPEPCPLVSIVIVTRNGRHHLETCLPSVMTQTYPQVEVVLVDDGSTDGTADYVAGHYPSVQIIEQANGPNFAAGNNQGIAHASGELIFLLNNDTILDPDCLWELVSVQANQADSGGVAAMMRFDDNRPFINGLGTTIRRLGFGHDLGIGSLDLGQYDQLLEIPFLCFGAALIPRHVFDQVGPIEEVYQFYYEDADWSYRARALGYRLVPAPRARVYHKFGASTGALPSAFKTSLASRNRLWFVLKNFPVTAALVQMSLYWFDDAAHFWVHLRRRQWDLARAVGHAWFQAVPGIPRVLRIRRHTWQGRQRVPVNVGALSRPFPLPEMYGKLPRLTQELIETQYQPFLQPRSTDETVQRLLIISPDTINKNMGGVGIRYWELANQLADLADVTLAVPGPTDLIAGNFTTVSYQVGQTSSLKPLTETVDIILLSGFTVYHHPFLKQLSHFVVVDLYDPMILENLERFSSKDRVEREGLHQLSVAAFNELFALGDFFICASEKQRDYWLGALSTVNRINPASYTMDPTLRRLIDTVPFGLPDKPPVHTRSVLKGVWPGINRDDKVILWGGGLWDWLDPLTVIEAMPAVLDQVPEARLFFLGTRHPNPEVPMPRMVLRAVERAEQLGLKDKAVFFNEWTPYEERANYLLEADVGVSLHGDHIETRFSVRTRLMDYLWARLPMVVGGGDVLSELVDSHQLGRVVSSGDVAGVAKSIVEMLQCQVKSAQFNQLTTDYRWSSVVGPLAEYVKSPWRDADERPAAVGSRSQSSPLALLPRKAVASLRQRGPIGLWQDVRAYMRWLMKH
jgi:GT2 family glycosyltransferase